MQGTSSTRAVDPGERHLCARNPPHGPDVTRRPRVGCAEGEQLVLFSWNTRDRLISLSLSTESGQMRADGARSPLPNRPATPTPRDHPSTRPGPPRLNDQNKNKPARQALAFSLSPPYSPQLAHPSPMRVASAALLSLACTQLVAAFPTPPPGSLDAPDALGLLPTILPNISGSEPPPYLDSGRYRSLAVARPPLRRRQSPPQRPAASLFIRFRRGLLDLGFLFGNSKYVPNPKHIPLNPSSSAAPKPSSTAKPSATSSPPAASVKPTPPTSTGCYPGNSLDIPTTPATASSLASWWCPHATEYAFMGFSYDQTPCQSGQQLVSQFTAMKKTYGARYVRLCALRTTPGCAARR